MPNGVANGTEPAGTARRWNMTKAEIITRIYEKVGFSKKDATLDTALERLADAVHRRKG